MNVYYIQKMFLGINPILWKNEFKYELERICINNIPGSRIAAFREVCVMSYEIKELYSIMPIANVPSVLRHGILSHDLAAKLQHVDLSMAEVQVRRDGKSVPGGLKLHQYVNLYFCARNPMMYARREQVANICVLRINVTVVHNAGVYSCDGNAASDYTHFYTHDEWRGNLDFPAIFADDWTDDNPFEQMRKKRVKCAEVLIPHCVESRFITGAFVGGKAGEINLRRAGFALDIQENKHIFFL